METEELDFRALSYAIVADMHGEIRTLHRKLYHTPKWRKIKRYRLFEKIEKLEEDRGLIEHVMLEDQ